MLILAEQLANKTLFHNIDNFVNPLLVFGRE